MATAPGNEDVATELNGVRDGWNAAMGVRFVRATADEVVVEWEVAAQHRQPYGIVHGGVHAGVIETIASVGRRSTRGREARPSSDSRTIRSFIHAVRDGVLRATARPITRGRRTQVWEGEVRDASGRIVATGRVRLLCLEPDSDLAGVAVGTPSRVG